MNPNPPPDPAHPRDHGGDEYDTRRRDEQPHTQPQPAADTFADRLRSLRELLAGPAPQPGDSDISGWLTRLYQHTGACLSAYLTERPPADGETSTQPLPELPPDDATRFLPGYLALFDAGLGYSIDLTDLDSITAYDPDNLIGWILSAAQHAGAQYALHVLRAPITQLREFIEEDPTDASVFTALLTKLDRQRHDLLSRQQAARQRHQRHLRALAPMGLTSHTAALTDTATHPQPHNTFKDPR
jgi:hypothetical protein